MGYDGFKRDRPSRLTQAISTLYPLRGNNFHQHPPLSREHKGRGEESEASTSVQRRYHPLCYSIRREKLQRHALNFGRLAPALRDRDQQIAAPRYGDTDGGAP